MSVISVEGLTKRHGRRRIVDDLTFDVRPGQVTGFLGPNGAGKSTTMRMVLGLDTPTFGRATVAGQPYRRLERPLSTVGSLLDANDIHGGRSARSHLDWLAVSNDLPRRRVVDVLELTGLASAARQRVRTYSLGMKQRLGLAAAMLGQPQVYVLDEPSNGLDPEGIQWLRTMLRSLASEGRTVFVSSHLITELALIADHVIVIGSGRLLADVGVGTLTADEGALEAAYFRLTQSAAGSEDS